MPYVLTIPFEGFKAPDIRLDGPVFIDTLGNEVYVIPNVLSGQIDALGACGQWQVPETTCLISAKSMKTEVLFGQIDWKQQLDGTRFPDSFDGQSVWRSNP